MINAKGNLVGSINSKQELIGTLNKAVEYIDPVTQEKEITPSKEIQIIEPDRAFTGLSKVTVNKIPDEYVVPNLGTKKITSNGIYKAKNDNFDGYAEIEVVTNGVDINEYFNNSLKSAGYYSPNWAGLIKKIPPIKITGDNAQFLFYQCQINGFTEIDTSEVTNMQYMFYGSKNTSLPEMDASKVDNIESFIINNTVLENFGGLLNLGKAYPNASVAERYALGLHNTAKITHDSLVNILNKLYDISDKHTQIINIGDTNKAKLTTEEIAIATNKGWTVY